MKTGRRLVRTGRKGVEDSRDQEEQKEGGEDGSEDREEESEGHEEASEDRRSTQ